MEPFQRGHPFVCKNSGEMLKGRRDPPRLVNLAPTRSSFETRMSVGPTPVRIQPPVETYPELSCCSSSEFETALKLTAPVPPSRTSSRTTNEQSEQSNQGSEQSVPIAKDYVVERNPLLLRFFDPPSYQAHNDIIFQDPPDEISEEDSEDAERPSSPLERTISDLSMASPEKFAAVAAMEQQKTEASLRTEPSYRSYSSEFSAASKLTPALPLVAPRSVRMEVRGLELSEQQDITRDFAPFVAESSLPTEVSIESEITRILDPPPYESLKEMSFPSLTEEISHETHVTENLVPASAIADLSHVPSMESEPIRVEKPEPSDDEISQEIPVESTKTRIEPADHKEEEIPCDDSEKGNEQSLSEQSKKLIEEACLITEEAQNPEPDNSSEHIEKQENWSDLSVNNEVVNESITPSLEKNQDYLSFKSNSMIAEGGEEVTPVDDVKEPVKYVHQPPDNEDHLRLEDSELPTEYLVEPTTEPEQYKNTYTLSDQDKELIEENNHFFEDALLPHADTPMSWSQILQGDGQTPSAPVMESARASESEMKDVEDYLKDFDSLVGDYDVIDGNDCEDEQPPETM